MRIFIKALTFLVLLSLCLYLSACSSSKNSFKAVAKNKSTTTTQAQSQTFLGSYGVEASWVIKENEKPGTLSWQIPPNLTGNTIDGYANLTGATQGQKVVLYVNTTAPQYHIDAFRMGYYQGLGARLIWQSPELPGYQQPACNFTPGVNMVWCNWKPSITVTINSNWPQGDYLFKLIADPGQQSYIPLTVWDPNSHATYLIDNSVFTWQAWNNFGGYDMYGGAPPGQTPTFKDRSRVMSFDRPYATGDGAGDFLGNELPLVEFVEKHGLDIAYINDVLFSENPNVILNHKVYLSLGHAECWDNQERDAAVNALNAGVNFVFFGASPILRHIRLQPGPHGTPDREMVDYRNPQEDPLYGKDNALVTGNTWAQPPTNLPASLIVGDTYGGYGIDDPMVIVDASAWPFAKTGLVNGFKLDNVVNFDYDYYDVNSPGPTDVQILAHSPVTGGTRTSNYSDMIYYTDLQSKAGVIATGTNFWIPSMTPCGAPSSSCPAPYLRKITGNILHLFGQGPAGEIEPSQTNWQQFYP